MKKRTLAFLLVLVLIFSMLPVTLVAAETAEAGYTLILQKAHNQTENALVVDIYLQANTADQADVTGYQFTVTPGTDLNVVVADATGNNGLATNGTTNTYAYNPDIAPAIPVGTAKKLVATATVTGAYIPKTIADLFTLTELQVVTADSSYTPAVTTVADYADCGHGTATWTAATEAGLANGGNYYLTGDMAVAAPVEIAAEKETVLCLNGYTLSAAADRIFNITGGKLTICDCDGGKLVPGTAQGGVADMTAGELILEDVVIDGAGIIGTAQGGAVYVGAAAKLTMNSCTVQNCTALEGSAVELLGEAIVTDTTFTGNHASSTANYKGGVIHVDGTGKLEMTGGAFTKNTGVGTASVLYIRGEGSHTKLTNVQITNNTLTSAYTKNDVPATTIVAMGDHKTIANTLELHNCTIENNAVKKTGVTSYTGLSGGVYFNKCTTLVIGGGTQFKNNTITHKSATIVRDVVAQNNGTNTINLADQWIKLENVTADAYVSVYFWTKLTEKTLNEHNVLSGAVGDAVIYDVNNNSRILGTDGAYTYAQHAHEDGYANVAGTQGWKPWSDSTSLPIESGYYYLTEDVNLTATWNIPANVRLCLNGHTIDGGDKIRLIAVGEGETLTVCDCQKSGQLTGGNYSWGPAIVVNGATASKNGGKLYMYDVKVTENSGTYVSAISTGANTDGTTKTDAYIYLEGVEFCNNTTTGGSGVIRTRDTGTADSASQIIAVNCKFHDNHVTGTGGVFYVSGKSTLTLTDSELYNNIATGNGGTVYLVDDSAMTASGTKFYDNATTKEGSAIYATNVKSVELDGCQIYDNSAGTANAVSIFGTTSFTMKDSSITNNTKGGLGIGQKVTGKLTLSGQAIVANNSGSDVSFYTTAADTATHPTQIYVNGLTDGSRFVVSSSNMTVTDADQAILVAEGGKQTTWCSSWINWENQSVDYVDSNADGALDDFVFATEHIHTDAQGNKITYTGITKLPADAAELEALADENGNVYVYLKKKISITAQYTVPGSMTICLNGYDISSSADRTLRVADASHTLTLDDCTATKTADGHYVAGGVTNTGNTARNGGLLFLSAGNFVMNEGRLHGLSYNGATGIAGLVVATGSSYNGSFTMNGGEICDNRAVSSKTGSAMSGVVQIQGPGTWTFKNGAIRNNSITATATTPTAVTGIDGGAIWTSGTGKMTIENFVIENNRSVSTGDGYIRNRGILYSTNGALTMTNVVIQNNVVEVTGAKSGSNTPTTQGGGAYLSGNRTVTMNNVDFIGNSSTSHAGAVYLANGVKPTFTECTFEDNTAGTYGGAFSAGNSLTIKFADCVFKNNTAVGNHGGAMYWQYLTDLQITGCTFEGNTAGNYGGAILLTGSAATNVATIGTAASGNIFTGNSAKQGGAIHTNGKAEVNITNGTFTKNVGKAVSAISVEGNNKVTIKDCTIQNNEADSYGAVYGYADAATLALAGKMIVTDNEGGDLYFQKTTSTTLGDLAVDVSGLTEGSSIGVNMKADRCESMPNFTMNGGAAQKAYFYPSTDKFVLGTLTVGETEELALFKHIENGVGYTTVQAAVEAAEKAGTGLKLQVNVTETLTVSTLSYLDLNGKDVAKVTVSDGAKLSLIDSTTNDYDCSDGFGSVTVEGAYKAYVEDTSSGSLKRYVVIADEDGKLSAHRIYLAITSKTLRPANAGVGFRAIFAGDEVVAENIVYGVQLSGYADFNQVLAASFDTMEPGALTNTPNQKTVVIYDAITKEDTSRWDADLYGRPFITIGETTVYGKEVTVNMKTMAANALGSGDATVIAAVNEMLAKCGVSAN